MKRDYLIIGQGIAGTTLAHRLKANGSSLLIVDDNPPTSSSKIASGLWNPVVLKRMKKVWRADEMIRDLHPFYRDIEKKLGTSLVEDKTVYRVLHSIEEQNNWYDHADQPAFEGILGKKIIPSAKDINTPFGLGEVVQSGRIHVGNYLGESRRYFQGHGELSEASLDYRDLRIHESGVEWKGMNFRSVIFCEGHHARSNPWFGYLPFAPTKGEVLIVESELKSEHPVHGGKFILPLTGKKYKIGATYDWKNLDEKRTDRGLDQLDAGWKKITGQSYTMMEHQAGIRPNVADRRPLLGRHPESQRAFIFNGLGSRGILMAPWLSRVMTDFLNKNLEIPSDMNISRFVKRFEQKPGR